MTEDPTRSQKKAQHKTDMLAKIAHLRPKPEQEQAAAWAKLMSKSAQVPIPRVFMHERSLAVVGPYGSGKRTTVKFMLGAIKHLSHYVVTTDTSALAAEIGGQAIYAQCRVRGGFESEDWSNPRRICGRFAPEKKHWFAKELAGARVWFICGTFSAQMLHCLDQVGRAVKGKADNASAHPFGGLAVVFVGDMANWSFDEETKQFPWRDLGPPNSRIIVLHELLLYADKEYAELLTRLRESRVLSPRGAKMLEEAEQRKLSSDALHLQRSYERREQYNKTCLKAIPGGMQVYVAVDVPRESVDGDTSSDEAPLRQAAPQLINMKVGARVVLKCSVEGVAAGSIGTVVELPRKANSEFNHHNYLVDCRTRALERARQNGLPEQPVHEKFDAEIDEYEPPKEGIKIKVAFDTITGTKTVLIGRKTFTASAEGSLDLKLYRKQYPLELGWSVTLSRAQYWPLRNTHGLVIADDVSRSFAYNAMTFVDDIKHIQLQSLFPLRSDNAGVDPQLLALEKKARETPFKMPQLQYKNVKENDRRVTDLFKRPRLTDN